MPRFAAYTGPAISLQQLLLSCARDSDTDGNPLGVGWYAPDNQPATYLSPLPAELDPNLAGLARSLSAAQWLLRQGAGKPDDLTGQPFADQEFLFIHDGEVEDFGIRLRPRLREALVADFEQDIRGHSCSEYLFAWLRQILAQDEEMPVEQGLMQWAQSLAAWLDDTPATLNVMVADGEVIYALRHAVNADPPALHFTVDEDAFPDGQLVASTVFTGSAFWQAVPSHHLLILDPTIPAQLTPV